jgi:hypothetical protein
MNLKKNPALRIPLCETQRTLRLNAFSFSPQRFAENTISLQTWYFLDARIALCLCGENLLR